MAERERSRFERGQVVWRARLLELGLPLLLVGTFLAFRLPGLGRGVTIDEVYWLNKSAIFAQALQAGEWTATGPSEHPGVTTLWAGWLGYRLQVGDFERLNLDAITDFHLRHALRQHGYNPVQVIAAGRLSIVLMNAAAFATLWWYAKRLWGPGAAALGLGLWAFDPFLVGHQRLLHQDGLMASFCALSLLALAAFLQGGRLRDALVSGVAAGLAWLTKSPTLALVPVVLLMAGTRLRVNSTDVLMGKRKMLRGLGVWAGAAGLVFVLLWPKMWAAPLQAMQGMLDYALGSAGGEFSGPVFFNGVVYPDGRMGLASAIFYPLSALWRATPLVLGGLAAALWVGQTGKGEGGEGKGSLAGLLLFALLFTAVMSLGVKKFDRYMLPAYAALLPVAGWGWSELLGRWGAAQAGARRRLWGLVGATAVLGGQLLSSAGLFPYYLSYYNPLLGGPQKAQEVMMIGWGEGLDQAAFYLQERGGLGGEAVASWYSNLFNLFFEKDAEEIPIAIELPDEALAELLEKEYLVVYAHEWQRETPKALLAALAEKEPEFSVWVNGLEFVRVYHLEE